MPNPQANDVKIFIPSQDFDLSLQFYAQLGWKVNWREGGLAEIELAGIRNYVQDFYAKDWAENFMIYIVVDDASAWHDHIAKVLETGSFPTAGVKPPEEQPYGAIVTFAYDPCGVLLHFAERVG